jgi:hypothetical protein
VARGNTFWEEDPVADLLTYLCETRPWANKVVAIAHNAKAYNLHFILNRTIILKWQPELIMNGQKIVSMEVEYLHFLQSVSYLPMPLRKLPQAFGLSATKSWYLHFFNTKENMDYIGPIPDISYYGADAMSDAERSEFLEWYETENRNIQ